MLVPALGAVEDMVPVQFHVETELDVVPTGVTVDFLPDPSHFAPFLFFSIDFSAVSYLLTGISENFVTPSH